MLEKKAESEGLTETEQGVLDDYRKVVDVRLDHVARMREAGVKLVAGSDASWGWYGLGEYQYEVEKHVTAGMSPMEAIVSATSDSAK